MHPTVPLFLALSTMLLIPAYPYYVVFFYTCLGIFFVCMTGRENNDIPYTLALPVAKRDAVRARVLITVAIQMAQLVTAALVAVLRAKLGVGTNDVGMDANVALFGIALVLFGLFNHMFFIRYYKDPLKVGKAFVISSTLYFVYMIIVEVCVHVFPFFQNRLDTPDPLFLPEKLATLAFGFVLYALLTWDACRKAEASFEQLDC